MKKEKKNHEDFCAHMCVCVNGVHTYTQQKKKKKTERGREIEIFTFEGSLSSSWLIKNSPISSVPSEPDCRQICVCECVRVHVSVWGCMCVCVCACVCVHTHTHTRTHIHRCPKVFVCLRVCTLDGEDMQRFGGLWAAEEYIKQQRAPLLFLTDSCWDYLAFLGWKLLQQGCQTLYTNYSRAKLLLYIVI